MREEPVVILTGPRTVGKSTLLAALAAEFGRPVLDLDRPDARTAAASDPSFIVSGPGPVLIDEFQRIAAYPKVHVIDSGLAGWLLGLSAAKIASRDPAALTEFGHLVETFASGRSSSR